MLYLTCTMISRVDLAHYGVSCAKDSVSMDCATNTLYLLLKHLLIEHSLLIVSVRKHNAENCAVVEINMRRCKPFCANVKRRYFFSYVVYLLSCCCYNRW